MTKRAAGFAVGALLMMAAGCGGGDDNGGGGSSGGGGGSSDEQQIKSTITTFVQGRDCSVATAKYRKELTGEASVKACSDALKQRNKVKKISFGPVTVSGTTAKVEVTTDGDKVPLDLVKQGGNWLISNSGGG